MGWVLIRKELLLGLREVSLGGVRRFGRTLVFLLLSSLWLDDEGDIAVSEFGFKCGLLAGVSFVGTIDIGIFWLIRNLEKARVDGTLKTGRWVTVSSCRFMPFSSTKIPALRLQFPQQSTHIN